MGEDNPVRAIGTFVDGFDPQKAGFVRAQAKETTQCSYHPGGLLKLYLCGYLNRVRSSRRLDAECANATLEVIWLLRGLRPDCKTIADFRRENAPALQGGLSPFRVSLRPDGFSLAQVARWTARASKPSTAKSAASRARSSRRCSATPTERLAGYLAGLG